MSKENFIKLEVDTKDVLKKLQGTPKTIKSASRTMMNAVNRKVVQKARRDFKATFNTKHLDGPPGRKVTPVEKSYRYGNSKWEPFTAFVSNTTFYSRFLEYGADIQPRHKNGWLTFKVNGEWKKAKSIHLDPRPILGPAVRQIWGDPEASRIMDEALQKALDRYWSKATN